MKEYRISDEAYANKIKYITDYNRDKYFKVTVFFRKDDVETVEFLENHRPISAYIKDLIKKDMERNKKGE